MNPAPPRLLRWPQRLRHQLLLLLVGCTTLTMAALYAVSTGRLEDAAVDAAGRWAESVGRVAAANGSGLLSGGDRVALEEALRGIAGMPGVLRLQVLDGEARPVLTLRRSREGQVSRDPVPLRLPAPETASDTVRVDGQQAVQAWIPAGPGGRVGSFGVLYAIDGERSQLAALLVEAELAIALVGLMTIVATYAFAARALAPLQRLARFSTEIGKRAGVSFEHPAGSCEVAELTDALNDASRALRDQMESLRRAEARTHALVNAVPDVILGFDADGSVRVANPGIASVFGLQPDEAVGHPLSDLLPGLTPEEAERRTLEGLYMRATQTHVARFEVEAARHGGTPFPAEVSLSRTETADGVRYAAVVRDMTEQRMTFSMLNLYSRALECTSNGVIICDMSLPGAPIFYANPSFHRITGYEVGEAIGRNCSFLQGDDLDQPAIAELERAIAEGRAAEVVVRHYRKDGTLFFNELSVAPVFGDDGRPQHYVGILEDVTERERARMAIAERSARLNAVFDLSPDGFVVFDADGRLVYCNPAFLAMTDWDLQREPVPLTVDEFDRRFLRLCDPGQAYAPIAPALATQAGGDSPDTLHLLKPERRVLTRMIRSAGEGRGEAILFFRDITRETEVDRMKSEFLTTAAHELRTPMVSVFGFTELLLRRPVPEERRRDMLETIHRQASLLIKMVNELLDLARIEARQGKDLKREPCRLDSLVTQAAGPLLIAGGAHEFEIDIAHPDGVLFVDPEKTNRALTNVLSNAVKYSPQGGRIRLTTVTGALRGEPAVGLRVADQGIGMTREQLTRIFERFYRADPSGNIPGTGLGMSLVKEIVELQGGRVELDSEPGRGTTVTLWLPLAETVDAAPAAPGSVQ